MRIAKDEYGKWVLHIKSVEIVLSSRLIFSSAKDRRFTVVSCAILTLLSPLVILLGFPWQIALMGTGWMAFWTIFNAFRPSRDTWRQFKESKNKPALPVAEDD